MHEAVRERGLRRALNAVWVDGVVWNPSARTVTFKRIYDPGRFRAGDPDSADFVRAMREAIDGIDFEGVTFEAVGSGSGHFKRGGTETAWFAVFRVRFPGDE